ncbi:MAG: DegT/DnrJ/EryC1/StrS family aminotransferase, partial [Sphingobacteriia bacterium]
GDVVLVPSFTYVATVNPVLYCGASPIFVDCEPDSYGMSPYWLAIALNDLKKQSKKPKAVILAHLYGQMAQAEEILALCNEHQVLLYEDAAEALGARQHGRQAGTIGTMGCYSFNGNKLFTTGGGGALVSAWPEPIQTAIHLATQATLRLPWYDHKELGYNYRMPHLSAAIGLAQLGRFDEQIARRREIHQAYTNTLQPHYRFLPEPEGFFHTHWLTVAHSERVSPLKTVQALQQQGIEARQVWKPLHKTPLYRQYPYYGGGNDERHFETGVCLPSGNRMKPEEMAEVVACLYELQDRQ